MMRVEINRLLRYFERVLVSAVFVSLAACSTVPQRDVVTPLIKSEAEVVDQNSSSQSQPTLGDEIALRAIAQLGKPYRYGGADLSGFDCSGLVYYIHRDLGLQVPRTASEQYAASKPVNVRQLIPGDLLFFRTKRSKRITHVGIYAGGGRFVHSPQTGKAIELRELNDEYYGPRLIGAGRLYSVRDVS